MNGRSWPAMLALVLVSACGRPAAEPANTVGQAPAPAPAQATTVAAKASSDDSSCCVPDPDEHKVRANLVGQIMGHESMPGDQDFVRENQGMGSRFDANTSVAELGRILTDELVAADRHRKKELCSAQDDVPCWSTMAATYAEDYATGFCFTMQSPQACVTTAARNAAYPSDEPIKDAQERKATELAMVAYKGHPRQK